MTRFIIFRKIFEKNIRKFLGKIMKVNQFLVKFDENSEVSRKYLEKF